VPRLIAVSILLACALAWPLAAAQSPAAQAPAAQAPAAPKPPAVVIPPGHATIVLWPDGAPGSEARRGEPEQIDGETVLNVHNPSIIAFLPAKAVATGVAIVMAPGGGHRSLWIMHEGVNPALALNEKGIAVFVLKNRLQSSGYSFDVEGLADMQRAIRTVRSRAAEWGVDPARIGAAGFSAGGELAALASYKEPVLTNAKDPIDMQSSRPDFQALIYPAIPADMKPTKDSPPAFLACGFGDRQNISEGLPNLYLLFKQAGVKTDLHVYAGAGHGFGIRDTDKTPAAGWPARFREWLDDQGFLGKK